MDASRPAILVCDDNSDLVDLLSGQLRRKGYAVCTAHSGQEALELMREEEIDLVILDIVMPGMTGLEVLRTIRETQDAEALPVMVLSGYSDAQYILEALHAGANDYVLKPLGHEVMLQRIEHHIRLQKGIQLLRESERSTRDLLESVPDLIMSLDPKLHILHFNRTPEGTQKRLFREDGERTEFTSEVQRLVQQMLSQVKSRRDERIRRKTISDAGPHAATFEFRLIPGGGAEWVLLVRDVTQFEVRERELLHLIGTDPLTRIANRRRFTEALQQEWRRQLRDRKPLSVAMVDVDHFKLLNDTLGHLAGDQCLTSLAGALDAVCMRPGDCAARIGGEEFGVLLPQTDQQGALIVGERIRQSIADLHIEHPHSTCGPYVTVSVGVASVVPDHEALPDELMRQADMALYKAKRSGRNRVAAHLAVDP